MDIQIIEEKENKVLKRKEIKFDSIYTGEATPTILSVKSKLVSLLNSKKDLLVVDILQPNFGEAKAAGYAKIYDSVEALNDIETEHVIEKNKGEEPPVEEKKEEEVVEDTTEEFSSDDAEQEEPVETEAIEEESKDGDD
ncbi:30S ribosomal protein S24e [Methanobrevibacter curvatus]|uniref:Small ribosomal subunit protein eS24 n=1 Tax=Methanobrevibacter curvatus TaxID=49547 RepID=A0A166BBY0_9EURY|nr:30S ribosomal protein S24e [Methanobrevibacter curvatus]